MLFPSIETGTAMNARESAEKNKNMKYMLYIKDQERVKSTLAIILNFE
jgi:hypothetical protein